MGWDRKDTVTTPSIWLLSRICNHISCLCCLFRTSEETLAIILVLLHLRFPRFPHGPVLSKQPSELHPLFFLKGHVEMSEFSCRSVLEAWEGQGGGGKERGTPTRFRGSSPPYTSEKISFSS